jgi:acetyl-CoA C-acetyltransferase
MTQRPVIAGTGQVSNKDEGSMVHPMVLVERAARLALENAGVEPTAVTGVYTTPISALTHSDVADLLAASLSAGPGPRVTSTYSGAAPQKLLAAACRAVAAEETQVAVVAGGIADASVRRARRAGIEPPAPPTSVWSQGSRAPRPEMSARDWGPEYIPEIACGAGYPSSYFALVQSTLDEGRERQERADALGRLLAPFTAAAGRRPELAWFPDERTPADIATASTANRWVAEPYTKLMCSFPTVDMAAALVVTADSVAGTARPVVHPLAIGTADEVSPPSGWPDMGRPPALGRLVRETLRVARATPAEMGGFDLYSCFPAAVLLAARELGLSPDDSRGLSASGGLPYFGGPGASYALHGLACLFEDLVGLNNPIGLAVGVGGMVTSFSVGVYSLEPGPLFDSVAIPAAEAPPVPTDPAARGRSVVEAMTVLHTSDGGPVEAPVIGRTAAGARFGARLADPAQATELSGRSLVGAEIEVTPEDGHLRYRPV